MNERIRAENLEAEEVSLECICGRTVTLSVLEDYDLPTFVGTCPCSRMWTLTEISAQARPEPDDEEARSTGGD